MDIILGTSIFAATFVLGIVQVTALLKAPKCNKKANIFMAAFLITGILVAFDCTLVTTGAYRDFPHLTKVFTPFNLLFGILSYLYSRALTQEKELNAKILWHFVPIIILYAIYSPVYFLSAEEKIRHISENQDFLLRKIVMIYIFLSNSVYMFKGYLNAAAHQKILRQGDDQIQLLKIYWLKQFFLVLLFVHFATVLSAFIFANQNFIAAYTVLFISIFIINTFSGYVSIRQIDRLYALVNIDGEKQIKTDLSSENGNSSISKIPDKVRDETAVALHKALFEDKAHLNSNLNLDALAQQVGFPSYIVSSVINSQYEMTFFELINSLRVKDASYRLKQEEYSNLTILAIAEDVGFNSKSSFNTAFKKYTGTTPSKFRSAKL